VRAWARRGWSSWRMGKQQKLSGNEQKSRGGGSRSRVAVRIACLPHDNRFGIESDATQSPCGRYSIGRVASSYTTICNSKHMTTEIDNTASNSHTYSGSKHNELNHEKRYTMPVVLLKWYTIPPSVQGARTTLKENNSLVAQQEIENEMWLVANSVWQID